MLRCWAYQLLSVKLHIKQSIHRDLPCNAGGHLESIHS